VENESLPSDIVDPRTKIGSTIINGSHERRLIFFFQAEDGIRNGHVTGVQTCALPISHAPTAGPPICERMSSAGDSRAPHATTTRSEERRVGKECRWRVWVTE